MARISHESKEAALEAIRVEGTMKVGALAAGVGVRTLNNEMSRSAIFKRRLLEAREEGKRNVADKAVEMIKLIASGTMEKTDRNVLTANIVLANAYEPGFRGITQVQGRIEHDVRVITAVPRPKYDLLPEPKVTVTIHKPTTEPKKLPRRTIKTPIVDENGHYLGTKTETVEEATEET